MEASRLRNGQLSTKGVAMRATLYCLGALALMAAGSGMAQAGPYPYGPRQAPDACGPGYCVTNAFGMIYGPNYWLTPPFPPFNGPTGMPCGQPSPNFPTHPYARGPRDYF